MIVICEECGKKYRIDPEKIKGSEAKFKCKACSHLITVQKPEKAPPPPKPQSVSAPAEPPKAAAPSSPAPPKKQPSSSKKKPRRKKKKKSGMTLGVRGKMILLFFLLPGMVSAFAALFSMIQITESTQEVVNESSQVIQNISELVVLNDTKSLAQKVSDYLENHPGLERTDLAEDATLKEIAVQSISWGGYVAIYSLPDEDGVWRTWVHRDPKIIGMDMRNVKDRLGKHFEQFWKIYTGVQNTTVSKGYYQWVEPNGQVKKKYMACRVIEGTPYVLASTVYLEDMLKPVNQLQAKADEQISYARYINIAIMVVAFIIIGTIVTIFGHRLTGKLSYLTNIADRISVGELETEIEIKSKDEIGHLAEAISRMQDSLRLSIERLRRRR